MANLNINNIIRNSLIIFYLFLALALFGGFGLENPKFTINVLLLLFSLPISFSITALGLIIFKKLTVLASLIFSIVPLVFFIFLMQKNLLALVNFFDVVLLIAAMLILVLYWTTFVKKKDKNG